VYDREVIDQGLRAGLYPRKSKDERTGKMSESVGEQERTGRADCAELGATVVDVYPDDGRSASRFATKTRDEWTRLRSDIDAGRLDLVWLWEVDRGGREVEDWAGFLNQCRRRGVKVYVHTHGRLYDPRVPRERRGLLEDGVDAEYDSEKKSLNVRRSLAANAVAGKPHGPTTYGYDRVYKIDDSGRRQFVKQQPHPDHAPVVADIFSRIARGVPMSHIVADLNAAGVPSPKGGAWQNCTVRLIARNAAYVGERRHRGEVHEAIWPPLVDQQTWVAVQTWLNNPDRYKRRPGRTRYLLSQVATSEACGSFIKGRPAYRNRVASYTCSCGRGCFSVRTEWLDQLLTDLVVARLSRPDVYADLVARSGDQSFAEAARAEAATLRARLDEHIDSAAAGTLTAATLAKLEAKLLPQIAEAERRAEQASVPPPLREFIHPAEDILTRWEQMPVAARKAVLRLLFARISVEPARGRLSLAQLPERVHVEWK
jgi:site-specific DNA recombinase